MSYKCISIDEAKMLIDKGQATIADVRDAGSYRAGRIENAVHVQQENVEEFLATAKRIGPSSCTATMATPARVQRTISSARVVPRSIVLMADTRRGD